MSNYVRARTTYELSAYSDFNNPRVFQHEIQYTTEAQGVVWQDIVVTAGAPVSYSLAQYTTILEIFVYNTDPAISLTAACQNAAAAAVSQVIGPTDGIRLVDVNKASPLVLTAVSATVAVQLVIIGT